jgi:hypothetical protein
MTLQALIPPLSDLSQKADPPASHQLNSPPTPRPHPTRRLLSPRPGVACSARSGSTARGTSLAPLPVGTVVCGRQQHVSTPRPPHFLRTTGP